MTTVAFNTALSALSSAQSALSIVGNNIANAATPGYSRQRVGLNTLPAMITTSRFQIGRGVEIDGVDRITDALLVDRLRNQRSEVGRYDVLSGHYRQLEALFGEPGPQGLNAMMSGFFADVSALTAAPEDIARRVGLIESGRSLADSFNVLSAQLMDTGRGLAEAIDSEVSIINAMTAELASLNDSIAQAAMGPSVPPDLLDRQEVLLGQLGEHVDVRTHREADGRVTVFSSGNVLVTPRGSSKLESFDIDPVSGRMGVRSTGATSDFEPRGGRLRALLDLSEEGVQRRMDSLDQLARTLILETNRVHSTGVPLGGGYKTLQSTNFFYDTNGSGSPLDDAIGSAELPFEVTGGSLMVNVTDNATGTVEQTRLTINPAMTVQQLVDAFNGIPGMSATVDPLGQLRLTALGDRGFDFSNRVQPVGDLDDTFGSASATITGTSQGPFALTAGDSFTVDVDGTGPQTVTFNAGQFANIGAATVEEIAAAINGQITGGTAEVSDGRLVLRSAASGITSTLQLADGTGSPLAAFGMSTALETGAATNVDIQFGGAFTGPEDLDLTFVPSGPGTIGVTPGLQINVMDANGSPVATLDVGPGYSAGDPLALADGVTVSFGAGDVDPAAGDRFTTSLVADSDTSDILVATGLGGFFTGSDAASMGVDQDLIDDPARLAAALDGNDGNNQNLLLLAEVFEKDADGLDGSSPDDFYRLLLTELGADSARAEQTLETQGLVLDSLQARRDEVSGVNIDEELLQMERFQQLYSVAARFLQTVQEVNDILINL